MAENSQGSALSRARLTVVMSEDRPSAPYNVHAETMSSSAILLAWERPLYNSDKVIAYSVHYMKAEGRWHGSLFSTPFASMDIAQLVKRLPGMHEAPTLIPRTTETQCGGSCLWSEHLGGRVRQIRSSRSSSTHSKFEADLGYMNLCLSQTKTKYLSSEWVTAYTIVERIFTKGTI